MEIRVKLTDKDRSSLGVEQEWLVVDPYEVSLNEVIVLQKGVEIEGVVCSYDSANAWRGGIDRGEAFATKVLVWLGLRRAGLKVDLGELDVSTNIDWNLIRDPTDVQEPGKDPSTPEMTS